MAKREFLKVVLTVAVIFILAVIAAVIAKPFGSFCAYVFPESRWAYAIMYDTNEDHVQVVSMPADCDFLHAPIGFKGCHYEKSVQVTRYNTDVHTHQPIISYDDGKTWTLLAAGQKSGRAEVYVSWDRVADAR